MYARPPCQACGLAFGPSWIPLADRCREAKQYSSYMCPRCSMGRCGLTHPRAPLLPQYKAHARAMAKAKDPAASRALARRRADLELLVRDQVQRNFPRPPTLVLDQLASLDPKLTQAVHRHVELRPVTQPLECAAKLAPASVDIMLCTRTLEYLHEPRAHLRAIAKLLSRSGLVRIEVLNLCEITDSLAHRVLSRERPSVFTPHALATMCSHAGLDPIRLELGPHIILVCRKAPMPRPPKIFPGPSALKIAKDAQLASLSADLHRLGTLEGQSPAYLECLTQALHARRDPSGRQKLSLLAAQPRQAATPTSMTLPN